MEQSHVKPHSSTVELPAVFIHGDDGKFVLASSREQAQRAADRAYGESMVLTDAGWFMDVGWDRDTYDRKRDFMMESGFDSWWEGCRPPADGQESKHRRRAWSVSYPPKAP